MNAEARQTHALLVQACEQGLLPPGWSVEKSWPWKTGTYLVAPERKGGVIVEERHVSVQLPGSGPARARVEITDGDQTNFAGPGWRDRITQAAEAIFKLSLPPEDPTEEAA